MNAPRPEAGDPTALLEDTLTQALAYIDSLDERPVAPSKGALEGLARFQEPLPENGNAAAETLALLQEAGTPATVASTGARYFGFVVGGVYPVALATSWLTSTWDQNSALPVMSPLAGRLNEVARDWLLDLFGFPMGTELALVSGASMGNATAFIAARDHLLANAGWDAQADGLFGAPPITVVIGQTIHSTTEKGLGLAGLGRKRVAVVPADEQGRMIASELPDIQGPVLVCAQAGEVNTGAFDPFAEIVSWARDRDAWVHVDGAFGLWALADPTRSHLVQGLRDVDSWVTDGHKFLNVSYDCGMAFVSGEDLRRSFASTAAYLPPEEGFEAFHHSPQGSQRARQIEIWATLRTLGRAGVAHLVQQACDCALLLAQGLSQAGLEVVNEVVFNQVLVRAGDDTATMDLIRCVQDDGTCWCGPTTFGGRAAMRISVSSWRTDETEARRSLDAIVDCARKVRAIES
jgi:glutamate/tyrosine decarboxylase-like PLP-dependent enzyme